MILTEEELEPVAHILEESFTLRFLPNDLDSLHLLSSLASKLCVTSLQRAHAQIGEADDYTHHHRLCERLLADAERHANGSHSVSLTVQDALELAQPVTAMVFFAVSGADLNCKLGNDQIVNAATRLMSAFRTGIQQVYELAGRFRSHDEYSPGPSIH